MVSPNGGAILNPKTSDPTLNSNLSIFPPKPWELDLGFHAKTPSDSHFFFFFNSDFGSHSQFSRGWELFNWFSTRFSPKTRIVNLECGNRTENPFENWIT
jgi:hypothetical protein